MSQEEDSSTLRLGSEFQDETCLSNAEVAIRLQKAKITYENEDKQVPEVFEQTLSYVNRFSQIKDPVANEAVAIELRNELEMKVWDKFDDNGQREEVKLAQFELVALMNLNPEDYDEAIALVPSLQSKVSEERINEVLEKINRSAGRTFDT
mmetsp:Transcript_17006/g.29261  ORF Transcript_17006/g.29261 Transcript_17006/m.29261 type:complete len:151 (-) Transcript_17006:239-691(-)|eukprot:CAMPEP_0203748564 /NCGR_PEP_ID=MMETSP0098-20131031/3414_1 /ASSEMBLY_ACC=CAM_ASM_000208 /TAXON_ID=96639 /ORGANISM=" , Strain NY0313808BC1" /LENGTH=150 /DNA_ID=CAMNT_0050637345 /DNA_START=713 /DNA_END=1165 /DNA_ORIENTATION=-